LIRLFSRKHPEHNVNLIVVLKINEGKIITYQNKIF